MKFPLIFAVLAASCFLESNAILNGQWWLDGPYVAHLTFLVNQGGQGGQGGGVIISSRHVLTTAFVSQSMFNIFEVRVGGALRANHRLLPVHSRVLHPQFVINPRANDIAIVVLRDVLHFDRFVQPIHLANIGSGWPVENEQLTVVGFGGFPGATQNRNLEAAFVRVTGGVRCNQVNLNNVNVNQQFCAEDARLRSDFCFDDTGSAAVALNRGKEVLVGLASVHRCVNTNPLNPSLFTRISGYRQWIDTTMAANNPPPQIP